MKKTVMETSCMEETAKYAFEMAQNAEPGQVFALIGDYIYGDGVCLIEWANRIEEILPEETIYIVIEKDLEKGMDYRKITVVRPE